MPHQEQIVSLCREYRNSGINIPWGCFSRIDGLKLPTLRLMKASGCKVIHYGLETGSSMLQVITNKCLDIEDAVSKVNQTLDMGICATVNFIIGFPEETERSLNETLDVMLRLRLMGAKIYATVLAPHAGTHYYQEYLDELQENPYRSDEIFFEEDYQLIREHPDLFSFFYYIKSPNIPILTFERIYFILINELLLSLPELLDLTIDHFSRDYITLMDKFCAYLNDRISQKNIDYNLVINTEFRKFSERIVNGNAYL
jgi:radical SAM superfamily enzyme YgiQ (UPF0313 family)